MRQQHFLLLAAVTLASINICRSVYSNILSELGSHLDTSCAEEQNCDCQLNEEFLRRMESVMNVSADPCENFIEYACGNWKSSSRNITSYYLEEIENYNKQIVDIFEKLKLESTYTKINAAYKKALYYYTTCRELRHFNLRDMLKEIVPGVKQQWPIYENRKSIPWNLNNFIWWKVFAMIQSYGLDDAFFSVALYSDGKRLSIRLYQYDAVAKLKLTKDILNAMGNYTNSQQLVLKWKLKNFEKELFKLYEGLSANNEETEAKDDQISQETTTVNFDNIKNSTTELGTEEGQTNNTNTENLNLTELQLQLPDIDWQVYFDLLLKNSTIKFRSKSKVFKLENAKTIQGVITFLNESSRETVALYMMAKLLEKLSKYVTVNTTESEQEKNCVKYLRKLTLFITNQLYEEHYYGSIRAESDLVINDIFLRLKTKLNDLIENNVFELSQTEIEQLQRKNDKIRLIIGDAPTNKTIKFLDDYSEALNITNETNFYHNHLELLNNNFLFNYYSVSYNATMLYFPLTDTTPYYFQLDNTIYFCYALLHMPSFHHNLHSVFQYSILGFILGHELMHGFDSDGVYYDSVGNFVPNLGNSINNKRIFAKRKECLQTEKTRSLEERIADISGLRLVMETFFNDRTSKTSKYHTHSTSLSNHKLFFLILSQFFCEKLGSQHVEVDHDPPSVRAVYTLANTREFAHAFQCREKTAMKPEDICQLW